MSKHKDVEYVVEDFQKNYRQIIFPSLEEAASYILVSAISTGEARGYLDVLIYSKAGARAYGGNAAVEAYEEDPEASVFERFQFDLKVNAQGRVP